MKLDAKLHRNSAPDPTSQTLFPPLRIDAWLASSLLQKAIRRSDVGLAQRAALSLHRARGAAIWRRFQIIAFEDVGVGSVSALASASSSNDPAWRAHLGGDIPTIIYVTRLLAEAPKDRSAEHLIRLAHGYEGYEEARDLVGLASHKDRLQFISDEDQPLHVRAISSWFVSGLNVGSERRFIGGDLAGALDALTSAGVPEQVVTATGIAAGKTKNPMCLMPALVWPATRTGEVPGTVKEHVSPAPMIGEVPAYALDKFTARGKAAISTFARENDGVRAALEANVADFRAYEAAAMAVFYAEGGLVALRYDWQGSRALEDLGTEQDLIEVGVSPGGVNALISAVRDNLAHLHDIRARLHRPTRSVEL